MGIPTVITLDATNVNESNATLNMDYDFKNYTGFVRFIYTENKWYLMADTPDKVQWGGSLTYDGSDIYALRGKDSKDFWKYDITSNTWSPIADTPDKVKEGGSLTYDGNGIYTLRGKDTKSFWKYGLPSIIWTNTAWEAKSSSGNYSKYISGLNKGTTYIFKAQLQYDSTIINGEVKSFIPS